MGSCSCAIQAASNTQCECMVCAQERGSVVVRNSAAARNVDYSAFVTHDYSSFKLAEASVGAANSSAINATPGLGRQGLQGATPQTFPEATSRPAKAKVDPDAPPNEYADFAECFQDLAAYLVRSGGNVFGTVAVRARVSTRTAADIFDPWSSYNDAANDYYTGVDAGSPGGDRLCLALSTDGRTWLKTGLILMDGAGVPCVAVEDDILYVYFNCINYDASGTAFDVLAVATTTNLVTWTYREMKSLPNASGHGLAWHNITNTTHTIPTTTISMTWEPNQPADPTVVPRPSGGWYLFVTVNRFTPGDPNPVSRDTFALKAAFLKDFTWDLVNKDNRVYPNDGVQLMAVAAGDPFLGTYDPSVLWMGSEMQYFAWGGTDGTGTQGNHDVRFTVNALDVFTVVSASTLA